MSNFSGYQNYPEACIMIPSLPACQEVPLESPVGEVLMQESAHSSLGIISLTFRAASVARKVLAPALSYSFPDIFENLSPGLSQIRVAKNCTSYFL